MLIMSFYRSLGHFLRYTFQFDSWNGYIVQASDLRPQTDSVHSVNAYVVCARRKIQSIEFIFVYNALQR